MEKPWSSLEKFPTGGPLGPLTVPRKSLKPPLEAGLLLGISLGKSLGAALLPWEASDSP